MAMPKSPAPPAPCRNCSAQIAPAPKKIRANVPMNSAVNFCGGLYIRDPPGREGNCARFNGGEFYLERQGDSSLAAHSPMVSRNMTLPQGPTPNPTPPHHPPP